MLHVMYVFLDNHFYSVAVNTCNTCMCRYLPWEGGGRVLPYMDYIHVGMCGPKGYVFFFAILVINKVLILAILVINRVWFLHSSLDMGMFLRRSHFFIIIEKEINKSPSQIMFMVIKRWSELGNFRYLQKSLLSMLTVEIFLCVARCFKIV